MIAIEALRTLTLQQPSRPGRPAHVSAASGLVRAGTHLYVVSDDENHLAIYPASGTRRGTLAQIFEGDLPLDAEARKRKKRDLETLARLPPLGKHRHGALLDPSGSIAATYRKIHLFDVSVDEGPVDTESARV